MTFDEWWNKKAARGQWIGEYEADAEANSRIGWEAALSHSSEMSEPLWCEVRGHYCRCHDYGKRCDDLDSGARKA
jgi:hypothetical protein